MQTYVAFLGHQPHISLAELSATVPGFQLQGIILKNYAKFDSTVELNAHFIDSLGGTITIAQQIKDNATVADVPPTLAKEMQGSRGKFTFGLRTVGLDPKHVKALYRHCKDKLKSKGRPCRYVGTERKPAPPVVLHDNNMFDPKKGMELMVIQSKGTVWIGKTIGAQNVNAYTKRDTEKPVRDTTVGLLPPKLAQIMLNFGLWLATADEAEDKERKRIRKRTITVFDPFCGTGVIPLECMLRGWHILGSDLSQKAVNGCEKNVEWIRKEMKILKKDVTATIWKQDATKAFDLKELPQVIVTETSLGPPIMKRPTQKEMLKMRTENEKMQEAFLKNAAETLPGVPIVCTWPVWYGSKIKLPLEKAWSAAKAAGYEVVLPPGIEAIDPERTSLLYRRPEQFVGREIVLLKPVSAQ